MSNLNPTNLRFGKEISETSIPLNEPGKTNEAKNFILVSSRELSLSNILLPVFALIGATINKN